MNFKQLVLAAAVLAVPFMAQAGMTSMDDSALSSVTGQDGISIAGNFAGTIGKLTYTDGDTGGGSLNLETITLTGFSIADNAPLTVDVVTTTIGTVATQQLAIGLPTMTGSVSVGAIRMGTGASIGGVAINNINMAGSTVRIWGH
ncbi:MAG: hypothetical protein K2Y25_05530 [Pseudomonadaceae bacterium]|jgi:hypothetical protein|nr:hypothetical protein [Pseudomonadaceae bacterium]